MSPRHTDRAHPLPARRAGRSVLCAALLCATLAGVLAACRPASTAVVAMDTQYYDDRGSILEIPQIAGDDSEAAQTINAALLARKAEYQRYVDDPFRDGTACTVTAYPTTTERYLNVALLENVSPGYGSDGTLCAWVYDKRERRAVTTSDALALAETTEDALRAAVAEAMLSGGDPLPLDEDTFEIRGFRIGGENTVTFYLQGANQDGVNGVDAWWGLYAWTAGTCTRCSGAWTPEDPAIVPTEEVDPLSPPLWCHWRLTGAEPEGGFTRARHDLRALAGADELRALAPSALGLSPGSLRADILSRSDLEDPAYWSYELSIPEGPAGSVEYLLSSGYQLCDTGALYLRTSLDGSAPPIRLTDGAGAVFPDRPLALLPPTLYEFQPDSLSAALFDAVEFEHDTTPDGHLMLCRINVLGSYPEGELTYYLCTVQERYYYDFLLDRGANQGGGADCAVIPLVEVGPEHYDYVPGSAVFGGDDLTPGQFFALQGAPADLCAQIDADYGSGVLRPQFSTLPVDEVYAAYLSNLFGAIDDTNQSKEAAAEAYVAALKAAGPGEDRYDALTGAFGPDAWDAVTLSYTQTRTAAARSALIDEATGRETAAGDPSGMAVTVTGGSEWRVDLHVQGSSAACFYVTDATGPWTLSRGLLLSV